MLCHEGTNHRPSPSHSAPIVVGTAVISNCQPVSTVAGTSTLPRFRISVPMAQPSPADRPSAKPSGALA